MNIGVYYRDTITKAWVEHATGLPLVAINEVEIQKSGAKLRIATYGRGVWESDLRNVVLPCPAPIDLSVDAITHNVAQVSWSPVEEAVTYTVQYKLTTDTGWTTVSDFTPNTKDTIAGLKSSSAYRWRVRSNCNMGTGVYAEGTFNTLVNGLVQQQTAKESLRIYPQPAENSLMLAFHLNSVSAAQITILDMLGNAVLGTNIAGFAGENQVALDVSVLPAGQYVLQVSTSYEQLTARCILVK